MWLQRMLFQAFMTFIGLFLFSQSSVGGLTEACLSFSILVHSPSAGGIPPNIAHCAATKETEEQAMEVCRPTSAELTPPPALVPVLSSKTRAVKTPKPRFSRNVVKCCSNCGAIGRCYLVSSETTWLDECAFQDFLSNCSCIRSILSNTAGKDVLLLSPPWPQAP